MLIAVMNDQKRELGDVERDLRDRNAYYQFIGLPVGTQLGLSLDGKSIATKIEDDAASKTHTAMATTSTIDTAKKAGRTAGEHGVDASANPYEDGSPEFLAWAAAYRDQQSQEAMRLDGGKENSAEARGRDAAIAGKPRSACPYKKLSQKAQKADWYRGFDGAKNDAAGRIAKRNGAGAHATA